MSWRLTCKWFGICQPDHSKVALLCSSPLTWKVPLIYLIQPQLPKAKLAALEVNKKQWGIGAEVSLGVGQGHRKGRSPGRTVAVLSSVPWENIS